MNKAVELLTDKRLLAVIVFLILLGVVRRFI